MNTEVNNTTPYFNQNIQISVIFVFRKHTGALLMTGISTLRNDESSSEAGDEKSTSESGSIHYVVGAAPESTAERELRMQPTPRF